MYLQHFSYLQNMQIILIILFLCISHYYPFCVAKQLVYTMAMRSLVEVYATRVNLSSIGHRTCEIIMKEKNTLVTRSCVRLDG